MNLNELFFFKTILCLKKEKHDLDICYYWHYINNDTRRLTVDFNLFFNKYENFELDEICDKNLLQIYTDEIGFENEEINELLFSGQNNIISQPCKNAYEHKYHVLNFKTSPCFFESNGFKCAYGKLCSSIHKDESTNQDVTLFKLFYENLLDYSRLISQKEVIEIYKRIYLNENSFTNTKYLFTKIENDKEREKLKNNEEITLINRIQSSTTENTKMKKMKNHSINTILRLENSLPAQNNNFLNEFLKNNNQNQIKTNIRNELKNIPILSKGDLYHNLINTDDLIVFISNSVPKKDELNKLVIAMLNSHSGVIIYGADVNSNKLAGIKMDRKVRDLFKQSFNSDYKDYLVEYEGCIKYKFYDLEENTMNKKVYSNNTKINSNLCAIVLKVKKIKDHKILFDPYNKAYTIKEKFLLKFEKNKEERITMNYIKHLNMKEYIENTKRKLMDYYKKKISIS